MLVFVAMNLRPTWQNGFKARNQDSLCIPKISIPHMAARCAARCSCQVRLCYIWYIYIWYIYLYIIYIYISLSLSPSPSPRVLAICVCYFHFKCFLWISRGPTWDVPGAPGAKQLLAAVSTSETGWRPASSVLVATCEARGAIDQTATACHDCPLVI